MTSRSDESSQPFSPTVLPSLQQVETLRGPAGRLEALLNGGAPDPPFAALVCHPYPPAGGTMHTKVVYRVMKALVAFGIPVLRFNFRGVGLSQGTFDDGEGEQQDVRSAVDWLDRTLARPVLFAGFSFGSYVGLRATCGDSRVVGQVALGLPVRAAGRNYTYDFIGQCQGPLLFLSGAQDEFCPAAALAAVANQAAVPQRTVLVDGADHFFQGTSLSPESKLEQMQAALQLWVKEEFLS